MTRDNRRAADRPEQERHRREHPTTKQSDKDTQQPPRRRAPREHAAGPQKPRKRHDPSSFKLPRRRKKQREHLPTFSVVTHDIMSARRVADYINVLWRGRIVEAGPAEDMLNSENPFIRQFLAGESQGPLTMD